jgi:hypothetical protein
MESTDAALCHDASSRPCWDQVRLGRNRVGQWQYNLVSTV